MHICKKAIAVCIEMNIPVVLWGGPGIGKSSMYKQLAVELQRRLRDVRLSDKEPSDLGGIPFPVEEDGHRQVLWLPNGLLPFKSNTDEDEECLLFLDEIDRCDKPVQNVALQIFLDRCVNGHELVDGCRIVAAGNGSSDTGTTPLTEAAATRLIHLYVDVNGATALDSFQRWAQKNGVAPELQGFSLFRQTAVVGETPKFVEQQKANLRTFTWASQLATACDSLDFGSEVIEPLVFGAVGCVSGREYLGYRRMFHSCPTPVAIAADPTGVALPVDFGLCFALGQQLTAVASVNGTSEDPELTKRFAQYVDRFPEEQKAHWFRTASEHLATLVHTPEYKAWEKTFRAF